MVWYEALIWVLGGSGCIGGLYSLYTAKVQKRKIQVEITQMLNDEWESLFDKLKKDTDDRIMSLEKKLCKLELKDEIQTKSINQFIKCEFAKKGYNCPVAMFIESANEAAQTVFTSTQISKLNGNES